MVRGRRGRIEKRNNGKNLLYTSLGILLLMIITFVITFLIYSHKIKNSNYSELSAEKIADLVPNDSYIKTQEASSEIGKSIQEVIENIEEQNEQNKQEESKAEQVKNKEKNIEENIEKNTEVKTTIQKEDVKEAEPVKDPEFSMPVDGEIMRNYAKDVLIYSETLQEWVTHLGIDIKAPRTTVVKAAEGGQVFAIKNDPRYGLTVIIEHTNGFKSIYSNLLTTEFVSEKDKVEKGQSIGTIGNSAAFEIVDEPHLHFEILKDDIQVDPNIYLK